ncbi:MAG: hypothetical protein IPG50_34135 [Myxococcales bacterium]|nr:hypothetical protein [Myxococcales bacterium]
MPKLQQFCDGTVVAPWCSEAMNMSQAKSTRTTARTLPWAAIDDQALDAVAGGISRTALAGHVGGDYDPLDAFTAAHGPQAAIHTILPQLPTTQLGVPQLGTQLGLGQPGVSQATIPLPLLQQLLGPQAAQAAPAASQVNPAQLMQSFAGMFQSMLGAAGRSSGASAPAPGGAPGANAGAGQGAGQSGGQSQGGQEGGEQGGGGAGGDSAGGSGTEGGNAGAESMGGGGGAEGASGQEQSFGNDFGGNSDFGAGDAGGGSMEA